MINVQNLTKRYGDFTAVENVSFSVGKGEILGFLGPNGAGKTTTMRILTCYMPATSGTATVAGFDVFEQSAEVRKRIGYLPEHPPLYMDMTVTDYLDFVARLKGVKRSEREAKIENTLGKCGLTEVRGRIIGHLSKGFKQRLGLAQAILHEPEVLVLDEPTLGLDPKQVVEIRKLIRSLKGKHTIILSTHILPEVAMTCDRVAIIHRGRVVAADTLENIGKRVGDTTKIYLRLRNPTDEVPERLSSIPGVTRVEPADGETGAYLVESEPDTDIGPELALTVLQGGWGLVELGRHGLSLEEVFVRLTAE